MVWPGGGQEMSRENPTEATPQERPRPPRGRGPPASATGGHGSMKPEANQSASVLSSGCLFVGHLG